MARELRIARERLSLSREQAADKMGLSASLVEKVEMGYVKPSPAYVEAAKSALADGIDTAGLFARMREDALRPVIGEWLRDYIELEEQAREIRWFEAHVAPALLQTEAYARALCGRDETTLVRLGRQGVLVRDDAPRVYVVLCEAALHRRVVGPGVMEEQLRRLAEAPAVVQVLPTNAETYAWADGSFVLVTVGDRKYVYAETPARGFCLDEREVVSRVEATWEELRAHALAPRESRELILGVAESWKSSG